MRDDKSRYGGLNGTTNTENVTNGQETLSNNIGIRSLLTISQIEEKIREYADLCNYKINNGNLLGLKIYDPYDIKIRRQILQQILHEFRFRKFLVEKGSVSVSSMRKEPITIAKTKQIRLSYDIDQEISVDVVMGKEVSWIIKQLEGHFYYSCEQIGRRIPALLQVFIDKVNLLAGVGEDIHVGKEFELMNDENLSLRDFLDKNNATYTKFFFIYFRAEFYFK